jgi:phospholipid transport system substrate-binding protein
MPHPTRRSVLAFLPYSLLSTLPLLPAEARAAEKTARQVIEEMVSNALKVLRDPAHKGKPVERKRLLRVIADRAFDWDAMARGSLGHYWRKLTDEQRKEFVSVFKDLLANQYMDDVDRFRGNEDVKILSAAPSAQLFKVKTELVTASNEHVPMDYTLHQAGPTWMIEDLSIEGVSMVSHYRTSFQRFLVNREFPDLLALLKRKLGR